MRHEPRASEVTEVFEADHSANGSGDTADDKTVPIRAAGPDAAPSPDHAPARLAEPPEQAAQSQPQRQPRTQPPTKPRRQPPSKLPVRPSSQPPSAPPGA